MAGGTAVAARAAPTAANPATDAKADDAAMARAKPKVDAAALLAEARGPTASSTCSSRTITRLWFSSRRC